MTWWARVSVHCIRGVCDRMQQSTAQKHLSPLSAIDVNALIVPWSYYKRHGRTADEKRSVGIQFPVSSFQHPVFIIRSGTYQVHTYQCTI